MPQKTSASLFFSERSRTDPSRLLEAVPHASFGQDHLRVRRILLELLTQVADVDVDRSLVAVLRVAEHVLEQFRAREDAARLTRERQQDLELEEGQLHGIAFDLDDALRRIDRQAALQQRLVGGLLAAVHARAPEHCLDATAQL